MIENYTDKETKYADEQRKLAVSGNTKVLGNTNVTATPNYSSPTNSIPPNYNINGTLNTDSSIHGNIYHHREDHEGLFYAIFNKSNIVFVIWFLAIYFIAYFILGFIFNKNEDVSNYQLRLSRTIDIICLFCLLIIIFSTYASYSNHQKETILQTTAEKTGEFIDDPLSIFSTLLFIGVFYVVVYLFRIPMDNLTKPIVISFIETIAWVLFAVILFNDFFKYVLGLSLTRMISKFFDWSSLPDYGYVIDYGNVKLSGNVNLKGNINLSGNTFTSQPVQKDEVFNISNNLYTYDDAQSICSSYGAKMATYDQIEDAYNHGGEWCNYGWSDGQMAFFPTQKSTWQELQKDPKRKNDCGRPGVNGGYFANPYVKFGVNCFGKKPAPKDSDLARMQSKQLGKIQPKNDQDNKLDKKVQFWKDNADKLLVINSYNNNEWSEY